MNVGPPVVALILAIQPVEGTDKVVLLTIVPDDTKQEEKRKAWKRQTAHGGKEWQEGRCWTVQRHLNDGGGKRSPEDWVYLTCFIDRGLTE